MVEENRIRNISFVFSANSSIEAELHVIDLHGFSLHLHNLLQEAIEERREREVLNISLEIHLDHIGI